VFRWWLALLLICVVARGDGPQSVVGARTARGPPAVPARSQQPVDPDGDREPGQAEKERAQENRRRHAGTGEVGGGDWILQPLGRVPSGGGVEGAGDVAQRGVIREAGPLVQGGGGEPFGAAERDQARVTAARGLGAGDDQAVDAVAGAAQAGPRHERQPVRCVHRLAGAQGEGAGRGGLLGVRAEGRGQLELADAVCK
jgi:hypothetical protein